MPSQEVQIRFECQGSGKCCVSHDGHGYVYFSLKDRRRIAEHLGIPTRTFTKDYCTKEGAFYHLKNLHGPCHFLKGKKCSVYEARPTQCRTWPFWPENMDAKKWKTEIAAFCPGVGKGPVIPAKEIKKNLKMDAWVR